MINISDILKLWNRHHVCLYNLLHFFRVLVFLRCFQNPRRVTADWSVGCCCSPSKSLHSPHFVYNEPAKKVGALFISHPFSFTSLLSLSLSPSHLCIFFTFPYRSPPQTGHVAPLALMDIIEPVDDIEEGEDGGEDHPGPLIDRVHVRQVWDVYLELWGPSS